MSSRIGLLERVRYLVEVENQPVNVRDRFDATPLYYACLCGHLEVVKYLLDKGAECEENTFDGERCLYAALTDHIKAMLKEHNVSVAHRDPYIEFLRQTLETETIGFHDVEFSVR